MHSLFKAFNAFNAFKTVRSAPGAVRLRATVAATLAVAVALGLVSAVLINVLQGSLERSAQAEAAAKAKKVATALRDGAPMTIAASVDGVAAPPGFGDVQVYNGDEPGPLWRPGTSYTVAKEQVVTPSQTLLVQSRASLAPAQDAIHALWSLLIPGVPALLLLVALLTWLAVGRALKPVSAIRAKLADITAHDLHQRVPEPSSRDEIAALARTVNATLDRLQTAVEQHKRFVADAAHELRSPLAILRTRLELGAAEADAASLASDALTDVARLQTLTADLLLLARLDAGEPLRDDEVDLGQVAAEEAAQTRPRPDVRVGLDIAGDVLVSGSGDQLRRLVANLVDNAVRHANSSVTVTVVTSDRTSALLEVADDGPGIPEEHRDTVFDRFTRLDQARARDQGGSGLGLAIARDIATAHGGTLCILPDTPGARLRATLPLRAESG
jgi:signal transduction histidine kinase